MIQSFRSESLKQLFENGTSKGLQPQFVTKIGIALDALDSSSHVTELDVPGFGLHELKGSRSGYWAISITRNWRITFRFVDGEPTDSSPRKTAAAQAVDLEFVAEEVEQTGAYEVDYEEYH